MNAKHQQLLSGVSLPAYWVSTWVYDNAIYAVTAGLSIAVIALYDIPEFTSTARNRAGATVALFFLYGPAVSSFTYVLSFFFKSHSTASNVVLFINLFSLILIIASSIMSQVRQRSNPSSRPVGARQLALRPPTPAQIDATCQADLGLRWIWRLMPGFDLGNGLLQVSVRHGVRPRGAACTHTSDAAPAPLPPARVPRHPATAGLDVRRQRGAW